jgi:hypothetical protein
MKLHQIKSSWYYVFWGVCAVAVVSGQLYVGTGYREMAKATRSAEILVSCAPPYEPSVNVKRNRTGEYE